MLLLFLGLPLNVQTLICQPVVDVLIYKLILRCSLHHAVPLLSEPPYNSEDRELGLTHMGHRVRIPHYTIRLNKEALTLLSVVMQAKHCLLQVVNSNETTCASYAGTAVKYNFVTLLHGCCATFFVYAARMVLSDMFNDRLDDFVVLLFGSPVVWPRQVLQMSHNPGLFRLSF